MKTYQGSCHCGSVRFRFISAEITSGLRCNCSICKRKGALMTDFFLAPTELNIESQTDCLTAYQFGSQIAKHYFCNKCGIYTFHQSVRKPGHFRVNIGCIDEIDALALPFTVFDGAAL